MYNVRDTTLKNIDMKVGRTKLHLYKINTILVSHPNWARHVWHYHPNEIRNLTRVIFSLDYFSLENIPLGVQYNIQL